MWRVDASVEASEINKGAYAGFLKKPFKLKRLLEMIEQIAP